MFKIYRRTLISWVLALLSGVQVSSRQRVAEANRLETLVGLAEAALPSELEPARLESVVSRFWSWLENYRTGVLDHGYGRSEIQESPPSPGSRWLSNLDALEETARSRLGRSFKDLALEQRRRLLQQQLPQTLQRLPVPADAEHVVDGLLAYFFRSSGAIDLVYRADIKVRQCRPLAAVQELPNRWG